MAKRTARQVLTIRRSRWRRGGESKRLVDAYGETQLLNDRGLMCCLGFDARACRVPACVLQRRADPSSLVDSGAVPKNGRYARTRTTGGFYTSNVQAVTAALQANDRKVLSARVREARVRRALKTLGWDDVRFVD